MIRALIAALAALACASAASSATLPATPATFAQVFKAAKSGDHIVLTGAFPQVFLYEQAWDAKAPLTVDASAATVRNVIFNGVTGVTWSGGTFAYDPAGHGAVYVVNSHNVSFDGLSVVGDRSQPGAIFLDSSDVALTNSTFDKPRSGLQLVRVQRAKVINDTFFGYGWDAITMADVVTADLSRNACIDPVTAPGIHPDCIQGLFSKAPGNSDLDIYLNYARGVTQFVFFNTTPGYVAAANVRIHDNFAMLGAVNAEDLDGGGSIMNNHNFTQPNAQWQARHYTPTPATVKVCGNADEAFKAWPAQADQPCPASK